jgi:hypothetical protein
MEDRYRVKFYKGDYRERQRNASRDKATVYVEHHFNSVENPSAAYTCVVVGSNASKKSIEVAQTYAGLVSQHFGTKLIGKEGALIGGFNGRGNSNVYYTDCPAVLLEPLFVSNPVHAAIVRSDRGQDTLAECLAFTIKECFPNGGLIAFSVGHKYKTAAPKDRGAPVVGGGNEADYAEIVLQKTANLLTKEIKVQPEPVPLKFSEDDTPAPFLQAAPPIEAAAQPAVNETPKEEPAPATAPPVNAEQAPSTKDETQDAPAKEGSTKTATVMTVAGIALPSFIAVGIKAITDLIAQGYVSAADIGQFVLGIVKENQKYVMMLIAAVIVLLIVKKVCKQITLWIQIWIKADPNKNNVEVIPQ